MVCAFFIFPWWTFCLAAKSIDELVDKTCTFSSEFDFSLLLEVCRVSSRLLSSQRRRLLQRNLSRFVRLDCKRFTTPQNHEDSLAWKTLTTLLKVSEDKVSLEQETVAQFYVRILRSIVQVGLGIYERQGKPRRVETNLQRESTLPWALRVLEALEYGGSKLTPLLKLQSLDEEMEETLRYCMIVCWNLG